MDMALGDLHGLVRKKISSTANRACLCEVPDHFPSSLKTESCDNLAEPEVLSLARQVFTGLNVSNRQNVVKPYTLTIKISVYTHS